MILFTDLDGTLLRDDKTISAGNRRAIEHLFDSGGSLVLTTGRALEGAAGFAEELSLRERGGYIAAFNGALIYDCAADRVLKRHAVPAETVQELFDAAGAAGIYAQTFCGGRILAARHTGELDYYRRNNRMEYEIAGDAAARLGRQPEQGWAAGPQKVMLIALEDKERLVRFQREHLAWERGRCSSVFSCPEYLEYCPWGVGKGSAVEYLEGVIRARGPVLPGQKAAVPQITIAVGDAENDLPMIRAAHIGVAVKNAEPEVKAAADYVAECDNNHDVIAEVMERFGAMLSRP